MMKVNFSIDFILGSSDKTKANIAEANEMCDKQHTVKWKPKTNNWTRPDCFDARSTELPIPPIREQINLMPSSLPTLFPLHNLHSSNCFGGFCPGLNYYQNFVSHNFNHLHYFNKHTENEFAAKPLDNSSHSPQTESIPNHRNLDLHPDDEETHNLSTNKQRKNCRKNAKRPKPLTKCVKVKPKSNRVGRRLFKGNQILELEEAFSQKPYLSRTERTELANKINLTECQIKTWFQNRRTKEKRRGPGFDDIDDVDVSDDISSDSSYQSKFIRVPGHGIQAEPTYGPPDKYLKAAIADFLNRQVIHSKKH